MTWAQLAVASVVELAALVQGRAPRSGSTGGMSPPWQELGLDDVAETTIDLRERIRSSSAP